MGLVNSCDISFSRDRRISCMMYNSVRVLNTFLVFKSEIKTISSARTDEMKLNLASYVSLSKMITVDQSIVFR